MIFVLEADSSWPEHQRIKHAKVIARCETQEQANEILDHLWCSRTVWWTEKEEDVSIQ